MILVIHILISVWIIYISPSKQQRNIVQLCTTPPPDCKISVFYASPYEIGYWNKKWSLTLQRRLSLPFQSFPTGLWLDQGEKQVVLVWFQNLPINTSRLVCIAKWKTLVLCLRGNRRFQTFKIRKYFPHSMDVHFSGSEHYWAGGLEDPNRVQGDEAAEGARADGQGERQQHKRHQHVNSLVCF